MIVLMNSEWTGGEVNLAVAILEKIARTQLDGKYLPLPVYEAHLRGKVNFSLEMALTDGDLQYYVAPRPEGDVYEGKWHFPGVTFILTDAEAGDPSFSKAFERFEERELGGTKLLSLLPLGHAVAHDPPRGPYVQFIFVGTPAVVPESVGKTGGRFMMLEEIERLDLVPSHRHNILPLLRPLPYFST